MAQTAYFEGANLPNRTTRSAICWGSVVGGVITGMVVQVLLSLLGLAIGFNVFEPGQHSYTGLGVGTTVWLVVSALLSGFAGGWTATALANISNRFDALMHGVLSWGLFMIVAFYMFGSGLGTIVGGAFNMTSAAITGASQGAVQNQGIAAVREQATNMTQTMAQPPTPVEQRQQRIQQEKAADTASKATWGAFVVALLSLCASALGGITGLRQKVYRTTATA